MSLVCKPAPERRAPRRRPPRERGVTLVELLVGLVIALVVMGGAFAAYLAVANSSRTNIRADRINIDVQSILDLMANDIRRAGHWSTPGTGNPFAIIHPSSGTSSCLLYSYDENQDGAKQDTERFGFRRSSTGVIEVRTSGASDIDCNNGTWQPLSDPNVMTVTTLTFRVQSQSVSSAGVTVQRRWIDIDLTATGANAADGITKVAQTTVEIRNDLRTP